MVLETIWFRAACLGFFLLFLIILYFFFPFGDFTIFRGILDIFGGKKGVFGPFGGILGLLEAF